jgi:archaellum component FlaF (FlaF/FlaG flagellin family)
MESAISAIIILTVFLFAVFSSALYFFSAQDSITESWQDMEVRMEEISRTSIQIVNAETNHTGTIVEITLTCTGSTRLADFDQWDVILQYESFSGQQISWYGPDEWSYGTYLDAPYVSDVFDPGILNPGEEMIIWIPVDPAISERSTNLSIVGTSNGVSASLAFTH